MNRVKVITALAVVAGSACAKPYSPPGGTQDRTPPRLVTTTPEALSIVRDLNTPVVFTFDETLAERGVNEGSVLVSPVPRGGVQVERKGNRVEVSARGGWQANQIYSVVLQPGVGDRFSNARTDQIETIFSTGPAMQNTALAGLVNDRLTARMLANGAVEAVRRADSAAYTARTDTAGFFAMRYLPTGLYDVVAYADQNNNRRRDPSEPFSRPQALTIGETDTLTVQMTVLPVDTSGPKIVRASMTDSIHINIVFDDAIDIDGLPGGTVAVSRADDNQPAGRITSMYLKNIWARIQATTAPAPRVDTTTPRTAADSAARRALAQEDSMVRSSRAGRVPLRGGFARDTTSVPDREVVVTIATPLPPGKYKVTMNGVRNVNALPGGGTAEFEVKAAPAPRAPGESRRRPATPAR